jgi:hypothetical protein
MAQVLRPPVQQWTVRPLPAGLSATPGTIEVWLPRPGAAGAS